MSKKNNYEDVKTEFESRGYTLVSETYVTCKEKLKYICSKHPDKVQEISYQGLHSGRGCRFCANEAIGNFRRKDISYAEEIFRLAGYELVPGQEYISCTHKLKYICPTHGVQEMHTNNMKSGKRCPECAIERRGDYRRLDYEYVKGEFEKVGYTLLSKTYEKANKKLKYLCPEHGEQKITYNDFQQSTRCPYCTGVSKGEAKIQEWLDNNHIVHSKEYTFENLVSDKNYRLRFDFAVFDYDNKLMLLIEYQGEQHYRPVERFGGEENFKRQQTNDKLKVDYCESNNIPLLRIKYTEFSYLEDILAEHILGGDNDGIA